MKMLRKLRSVLCSSMAFIMVYAFAVAVWVIDRENFMMVLLFFVFCVVLAFAVISGNSHQYEYYEHIAHIITVPEVTK